jgi:hypothetical protein
MQKSFLYRFSLVLGLAFLVNLPQEASALRSGFKVYRKSSKTGRMVHPDPESQFNTSSGRFRYVRSSGRHRQVVDTTTGEILYVHQKAITSGDRKNPADPSQYKPVNADAASEQKPAGSLFVDQPTRLNNGDRPGERTPVPIPRSKPERKVSEDKPRQEDPKKIGGGGLVAASLGAFTPRKTHSARPKERPASPRADRTHEVVLESVKALRPGFKLYRMNDVGKIEKSLPFETYNTANSQRFRHISGGALGEYLRVLDQLTQEILYVHQSGIDPQHIGKTIQQARLRMASLPPAAAQLGGARPKAASGLAPAPLTEENKDVAVEANPTEPQGEDQLSASQVHPSCYYPLNETKQKNCMKIIKEVEAGKLPKKPVMFALKALHEKVGRQCAGKKVTNDCQVFVANLDKRMPKQPHRSPGYFFNICAGDKSKTPFKDVISRTYVNRGTGSARGRYTDVGGRKTTLPGVFVSGRLTGFHPATARSRSKYARMLGYKKSDRRCRGSGNSKNGFLKSCPVLRLAMARVGGASTDESKPMHTSPFRSSSGCPSIARKDNWIMRSMAAHGQSLFIAYTDTDRYRSNFKRRCSGRSANKQLNQTASSSSQ